MLIKLDFVEYTLMTNSKQAEICDQVVFIYYFLSTAIFYA